MKSGWSHPQGEAFEDLLDQIPVHLSTMVCKTALVVEYFASDLYDDDLRLGDVPLLLYCAAKARVGYLPISTSTYRSVPTSFTNRSREHLSRVVRDHAKVVRRFEERFKSDPARRVARAKRLDALVAASAYACGDIGTYRDMGPGGTKAQLRRILMQFPRLHRTYMAAVSARQKLHFWKHSEDAGWPD